MKELSSKFYLDSIREKQAALWVIQVVVWKIDDHIPNKTYGVEQLHENFYYHLRRHTCIAYSIDYVTTSDAS